MFLPIAKKNKLKIRHIKDFNSPKGANFRFSLVAADNDTTLPEVKHLKPQNDNSKTRIEETNRSLSKKRVITKVV